MTKYYKSYDGMALYRVSDRFDHPVSIWDVEERRWRGTYFQNSFQLFCHIPAGEVGESEVSRFTACEPRPPVGLRSRKAAALARVIEIAEACKRHLDAGSPIPQTWLEELQEVTKEL